MRTLRFIATNQKMEKDPNCNFDGLVPGSEGYLKAEFMLSPEWRESAAIVVSFWSALGKEYSPQVLGNDHTCVIPAEALERRIFKIQLIGLDKNGRRLKTNKVTVDQNS